MSNITLRKLGGETLEVTMLTLFGMLADEDSHFDVVSRLNRETRITVELKDGPAQIWRTSTTSLPIPRPAQALLPLSLSDFTASAQLHFAIPARVHCTAGSPAEAAEAIRAALMGQRGTPPGFKIEINQDDVEAFFTSLDIGSYAAVEGVTIHGVDPRILIGTDASS
jgi:hypothetical protein